jgi:hypothetical protein
MVRCDRAIGTGRPGLLVPRLKQRMNQLKQRGILP